MKKISEHKGEKVEFVETLDVKEGVVCDVYTFTETNEKDLGIIEIKAGFSTPLQKVLKGDRTIEELIEGDGVLTVIDVSRNKTEYHQTHNNHDPIEVKVGELMQWTAKIDMVFSEICFPPYEDGRYENLE